MREELKNKRVLRVLEFNKIQDMLAEFSVSEISKEKIKELYPSTDYNEVYALQKETTEAETILFRLGRNPIDYFPDIRGTVERARIGSVLNPKEILNTAVCLKTARNVQSSISFNNVDCPKIEGMVSALKTNKILENDIFRSIISEDEISDQASRELYNVRRLIKQTNESIKDKLNNMIHSTHYQKFLQDSIVTVRNGRYVIPVKQEHKADINGLVHDQSSSGATLFIEPMAIVQVNNELRQLMVREKKEIERILSQFTLRISEIADDLDRNVIILSDLDFVFSKGLLSRKFNCVEPKLNDNGYINIKKGRHPLIPADKVVPIDIWLGKEFTTLIITGPNTGGKTVTLKTVGLLVLMAQSGLHVPADIGTEIPVFEKVFADIGDEQSIEQSLSTFSSHIKNIINIMQNLTMNSLVLLDELGAGTDPTEGAALAIAILNELLSDKIRTIATTHYSELKAFALTSEGIENASVEFDVEKLAPTYHLSIGIPGKSNAFEISKKLGLDDDIINNARKYLTNENVKFEDVISNAENQRKLAQKDRKIAEDARIEIVSLRNEIEEQKKLIGQQKEKILRQAKEDAKRILYQAKEQSESTIREIRRLADKKSYEIQMSDIQNRKSDISRSINQIDSELGVKENKQSKKPISKELKLGDSVFVNKLNQTGILISKPDSKGDVQVQVGIIKLKSNINELSDAEQNESNVESYVKKDINMKERHISLELDLRGMNLDEAVMQVDKYLDDAFLSGLSEVNIIHGKGTGILRTGIHKYLERHPHVESFRIGKYGEGDSGVTVVKIK